MNTTLSLRNIKKIYQDDNGEILAVKDFSYDFNKGDFVSIVGPSRLWEINYSIYYFRT